MAKELGPIKYWSFSRLLDWEACKYRCYLAMVLKEKPKPPNPEVESPLERGDRIHKGCEKFVLGQERKPPQEAMKFVHMLDNLRERYKKEPDSVLVEKNWCFNYDLQLVDEKDFKNIWLRVKMDVDVKLSPYERTLIDYKTGKLFNNEIKHARQGQFYAGAGCVLLPEVKLFNVEFWYFDQDCTTNIAYTRRTAMKFWESYINKGREMTTANRFPASPNAHNCRFCNFGIDNGTGVCKHAVSFEDKGKPKNVQFHKRK